MIIWFHLWHVPKIENFDPNSSTFRMNLLLSIAEKLSDEWRISDISRRQRKSMLYGTSSKASDSVYSKGTTNV